MVNGEKVGIGRALPMAGERTRAERRDAAENRQQILAAAAELFAARGVEAVSMDEIARAAGVGKGTLYRRYAHKGALCQALLDENTRRMQGAVLDGLRDRQRGALDHLADFLAHLVAHNEENAELLSAVSDAAFGSRRDAFYRSAPYQWQRLMITGFLRRAVADGECRDLDIDYLTDALLAPLDIDLYLFQRRALGLEQARIVAGTQRLLIDGLRARG
ncbi:MAG TPA: TetR/AcrR family transcriptional regulator [Thermomicrobiales bacterium]